MESDAAPSEWRVVNVTLVLPDRLLERGAVHVRGGRIESVGSAADLPAWRGTTVDGGGQYAAPGFVDMHVHGGGGADFMDGTAAAFETAVRAHTRHGTTSIVPTTTVARHEQTMRFFELCQEFFCAIVRPWNSLSLGIIGPCASISFRTKATASECSSKIF